MGSTNFLANSRRDSVGSCLPQLFYISFKDTIFVETWQE